MAQLEERLSGLFKETYRGRAMTVARSESFQSYSQASVVGHLESGQIAYVEILDNPNHDTDPSPIDGLTCAGRNGLIVPIGRAEIHIESEHPNGTMAVAPVIT